jgi:maleate cis-trans isomerase
VTKRFRVGETEIPEMLRRREGIRPERFTFHSSRARLHTVTREELERMVNDSDRWPSSSPTRGWMSSRTPASWR